MSGVPHDDWDPDPAWRNPAVRMADVLQSPPPRRVDWRVAAVVLVVLAALIAVPAILALVVPDRETPQSAGSVIELSAAGTEPDTVNFAGVDGWDRRATGDGSAALLTRDDSVLAVNVVNGVTDFGAAADWRLKVLGVEGFPAEWDRDWELWNRHGFAGPVCRGTEAKGVCAILGNKNLVVTLVLHGDDATLDQLDQIVDTLQVEQ
ncbi:hypothetical protein [Nocardia sp. XZ_19_385]|uniref:hypothetical protein n=1 Tax=Nocardia sp. XZ_19_385 TaxID=2769488 RepID=UPI00188FAE34|nr:hypothetical protein [Nocardia sp. XZ_19_385]